MTDNKDLKYIQQFKKEPNIPKTETRIVLNDWSQGAKKSSLSASARSKVINRSGGNYLSESQEYGPCSYYGCSYPNVPFDLSISVEGQSRNWANRSGRNSFPGSWTYSSHILGSYSWRENLWLKNIDQGQDAINLMNNNNALFIVNAAGLFCVENDKFCNNAKDIINKCIFHHKKGVAINESEIISSDLHKYAKWTVKTAAIVAATAVNPVGTAVIGGTVWGAGKAMEHHPDANDYDKGIFRSISGFGGDMVKSGVSGSIFKGLTSAWSPDVKGVYDTYEKVSTGKDLFLDFNYHQDHVARGSSYKSDCEVCKTQLS